MIPELLKILDKYRCHWKELLQLNLIRSIDDDDDSNEVDYNKYSLYHIRDADCDVLVIGDKQDNSSSSITIIKGFIIGSKSINDIDWILRSDEWETCAYSYNDVIDKEDL